MIAEATWIVNTLATCLTIRERLQRELIAWCPRSNPKKHTYQDIVSFQMMLLTQVPSREPVRPRDQSSVSEASTGLAHHQK